MTKTLRNLALLLLVAVLCAACARSSTTGANAKPHDLLAAEPTESDVESVIGTRSWWPGAPSFGVRPLDSASMPFQERYHVIQRFAHIGTAETLDVEYTLWDSTSTATTQMTNVQSALGTTASGAKVGDQALYYGQQGSGAAPYQTETFVRTGQVVTTITLTLKDGFPSVATLGRIATKFVTRLKNVLAGKAPSSPAPTVSGALLPPPGPDLTLLGSTILPTESIVVMLNFSSPESLAGILHSNGVDQVVFGDYALDNDTHMEVRAGVMDFSSAQYASDWITALRGSATPDANGIATFYDDASGQYFSLFISGTKGAFLICRSTSSAEAASRACEGPLSRVAPSWQVSLGG